VVGLGLKLLCENILIHSVSIDNVCILLKQSDKYQVKTTLETSEQTTLETSEQTTLETSEETTLETSEETTKSLNVLKHSTL
jgi:hypothetical protein